VFATAPERLQHFKESRHYKFSQNLSYYSMSVFIFQAPKQRSKTIILAKNLPARTSVTEIQQIFMKYGELGRVVMPPTGITGNKYFIKYKNMSAFRD
jgi:hypothetical protein